MHHLSVIDGHADLLATAFEHGLVAKAVVGLAPGERGVLLAVNAAWCALLGHPREDLLGPSVEGTALVERILAPDVLEAMARGDRDRLEREGGLLRRDGSTVWVLLRAVVVPSESGGHDPDAPSPPSLLVVEAVEAVEAGEVVGAGAASVVADAERRSRQLVEDAVARELARLGTTIAVQREVIAAATDRDALLQLAADRAAAVLPAADAVVIEVLDGDQLFCAAASGSLARSVGMRVSVQGSLSGLATTTGEAQRCDDTAVDTRVDRAACQRAGIGSMLVAPFGSGGDTIGALKVSNRGAGAFDSSDEHQLTLLADALGSALRQVTDQAHVAQVYDEATRALGALAVSEARFRSAFGNGPLGMVLTSLAPAGFGTFLEANEAMADITGYPVVDLIGMHFSQLHQREDAEETLEILRRFAGGALDTVVIERRYRHAAGHAVWVEIHAAMVRDEHGAPSYLVSQIEDVTGRREAATRLAQRAHLLDLTQDAVIVRDLDGLVRYWNPAAEKVYGWPAEDAIGRHLDRLLETRRLSGADDHELMTHLLTKGRWEGEVEHRRADGRLLVVLTHKALARDADGEPSSVLSINTDITDRKAAEADRDAANAHLEDRNQQLEAANQLKVDLMGMLGHELGNPLAAILGYTELARELWSTLPDSEQWDMLATIERNAQRLDGIVREVLALVTVDAGKLAAVPQVVDLRPRLVTALARDRGSHARAPVVDCSPSVTVSVQPGHLDQIMANLISNADKYAGGVTAIRVDFLGLDVAIRVQDAGPGVALDFREHLFERFTRDATTADRVRGTGLGLHIVQELARANAGDVRYEVGPAGSAFVVTLPAG